MIVADPARFRMDVMQMSSAVGDKPLADSDRKRQIGHPAPVQMADFATTDVEKDHSIRIFFDADVGPRSDFFADFA